MTETPRVLSIGGLDPCGGAGIVMDARMVEACGGFALTVPACLTVQNRRGVGRVEPLEDGLFNEMLDAAFDDGPVHAVKIGLLGAARRVPQVVESLQARAAGLPCVVDPVLGTTAGGWTADDDLIAAYRDLLLPRATIATPNRRELEALSTEGSGALLAAGCGAVLQTGGDGEGNAVEDHLSTSHRSEVVFHHPRIDLGPVHGTGCALAAALACGLGRGLDVEESCRQAVAAVARSLGAMVPGAMVPGAMVPGAGGLPVPLLVWPRSTGATGAAATATAHR